MQVENLVIKNLLNDEEYLRKSLPFIKSEYFSETGDRNIFEIISKYFSDYNAIPTKEALQIEAGNLTDISDDQYNSLLEYIKNIDDEESDLQWALDTTEKWCKERAVYLALMESIKIADGNDKNKGPEAIPSILSDALSVSFDNHIGHDYIDDYEERYESYHRVDAKIPFDIEMLNKTDYKCVVQSINNTSLIAGLTSKDFILSTTRAPEGWQECIDNVFDRTRGLHG